MIPATQRPDGTWRKPRKIRAGFNASKGGATRYVPPAFRSSSAAGEESERVQVDGGQSRSTRSLYEIASASGGRGHGRNQFVDAVLFLLTAATSFPADTSSSPSQEQCGRSTPADTKRQENSDDDNDNDGDCVTANCEPEGRPKTDHPEHHKWQQEDQHRNLQNPTIQTSVFASPNPALQRQVARVVNDEIGCTHCRPLSPASVTQNFTDALDGDNSAATSALRAAGSNIPQDGDIWWGRLQQVLNGRDNSVPQAKVGVGERQRGRQGQEWVGFELSLRATDVGHPEGQHAIVNFLKRRVDAFEMPRQYNAEPTTTPQSFDVAVDAVKKPAGKMEPVASENGVEVSTGMALVSRRTKGNSADIDDEAWDGIRCCAAEECGSKCKSGTRRELTTLSAILVFGAGSLSKRDRAELHRQAENTSRVASASFGVGDGRLLALSCGCGASMADVKLSADKVALAQRLFRRAQLQYHSRYEQLSHREIRETVAAGGPTAEDHPHLFLLLEKDNEEGLQTDGRHDTADPGRSLAIAASKDTDDVHNDGSRKGAKSHLSEMKETTLDTARRNGNGKRDAATEEKARHRPESIGSDIAENELPRKPCPW